LERRYTKSLRGKELEKLQKVAAGVDSPRKLKKRSLQVVAAQGVQANRESSGGGRGKTETSDKTRRVKPFLATRRIYAIYHRQYHAPEITQEVNSYYPNSHNWFMSPNLTCP
jgi:hypothetical protein